MASPAQPQDSSLELRSAYLIKEGTADALTETLQRLSREYAPLGYHFELTGPWPAFSFAGGLREALA